MTAEELNKTLPNVFKAFAMICDDNSHDFDWDVPERWQQRLGIVNEALGKLSDDELETFCIGDDAASLEIAQRTTDLTIAHAFLEAFFSEWNDTVLAYEPSPNAGTPPPKLEYRNDDTCWIFAHEIDEETGKQVLSQGKVMFRFTARDMVGVFHVIRLGDPDYSFFEVRDALTMTPDPNILPPFVGTSAPMKGRDTPNDTTTN